MGDSEKEPLISIVISFCNEEEVIPELIDRLNRSLQPLPVNYEILFVNDASTDGSLALLKEKSSRDRRIKIVNLSRNFAKKFDSGRSGVCHIAGLEHASGDAVITMDADLQDPPELLSEMIDAWRKDDDVHVVYTVRRSRKGEFFLKTWMTWMGYKILSFISDVEIRCHSGDYRLLSRRVLDHFTQFKEKRPFLRGMVSWVGFKQVPVYYDRKERFAGNSHFPIYGRSVIYNFLYAIVSFSERPLQFVFWIGLLSLPLGFLFLLFVLASPLFKIPLPEMSLGFAFMSAIGSVQLFAIGLMSLYVLAIFDQARDRPLYVVESKIGFED